MISSQKKNKKIRKKCCFAIITGPIRQGETCHPRRNCSLFTNNVFSLICRAKILRHDKNCIDTINSICDVDSSRTKTRSDGRFQTMRKCHCACALNCFTVHRRDAGIGFFALLFLYTRRFACASAFYMFTIVDV